MRREDSLCIPKHHLGECDRKPCFLLDPNYRERGRVNGGRNNSTVGDAM